MYRSFRESSGRLWLPAVVAALLCLLMLPTGLLAELSEGASPHLSTADHARMPALQGPFESGPEVTRACLSCHNRAARQVQESLHWTWAYDAPDSGRGYGKSRVFNAFCGSPQGNWSKCTICHAGYGWKDPGITQTSEEQVDCLVCHEQTGEYRKFDYGDPVLKHRGRIIRKPDFAKLAQSVGRPSRQNCGSCHFFGGAHDGAKHGDLDSSLLAPGRQLDVHMDSAGLDFSCVTCHTGEGHRITGSRYRMKAFDALGIDRPGHTDATRTSCESCHGTRPHPQTPKLDSHTRRIACQTCHIPRFARGRVPTKTYWDWRSAGKEPPKAQAEVSEGRAVAPKGNSGDDEAVSGRAPRVTQTFQHGSITWEEQVVPEYRWFDGRIDYILPGESVGDGTSVAINRLSGAASDRDSRIWPFKVMRAQLPFDPVNRTLVFNRLVAASPDDKDALYESYDWQRSVTAGMQLPGAPPFSGKVGFIEAAMFFPITHMVAPKEEALRCNDCHSRNGRMAGLTGFYMPGRDSFPLLVFLGWSLVVATLVGVLLHGAAQASFRKKSAAAAGSVTIHREFIFSLYERFWHWTQAILIFGLMITGFNVSGVHNLFGYEKATTGHYYFAWGLIWLWVFTLFWHMITGEWRQYIPTTRKLMDMVHYYMKGIFYPERYPHPFKKSRRLKHNPLQRFSYFSLHIVVMPVIWVSGTLYIYYGGFHAGGLESVPLGVIAGIHSTTAFLMLSFVVLHVYMAFFIGAPVTGKLKGMITGFVETAIAALDRTTQYRILMVDDDNDFIRLVQAWLGGSGHERDKSILPNELILVPRGSRKEAIRELRQDNYDLILLDLGLPDSEGLDTFLKIYDVRPDIPILVLTGLEESTIGPETVMNGAQDFLDKADIDAKKLLRSIRFALERDQFARSHLSSYRQ
ncbi:MAG: tetrathionate reductase family octaheme c-type cytochrome [Magnetococcales bacterium]|nr:tetrathionate reductase family octaheme c-type cytochrome [Magnetococcales bacterium]